MNSLRSVLLLSFAWLSTSLAQEKPLNIAGLEALTKEIDHLQTVTLAYACAKASYLMPQLTASSTLASCEAKFKEFQDTIPASYQVFGADGGVSSGLKFVILKPRKDDDTQPWVVAITGSESTIDFLVDADLGLDQFEELKNIVIMCGSHVLARKKLLITGHSLGGGLGQALAHEVQALRNQIGSTAKVTLVTWNPVGSQTMLQRAGKKFNPALLQQVDAYNYFMRGDPISRVDHHFGKTYEFVASDADYAIPGFKERMERLHSLEIFEPVMKRKDIQALKQAQCVAPPSAETINKLTSFSWLFTYGTNVIHTFRQLWVVKQLTLVLRDVRPEDFADPVRADTIRFIYCMAAHEPAQIEATKDRDRIQYVPALRAQLQRVEPMISQYTRAVESIVKP